MSKYGGINTDSFLTMQCLPIDAQSIKPIFSDFSSLKTLKIIRSNIEDQKSKLYRKMKKSKVKKNVVKLTVIRDSQYDRYMKKFQPKATCQCRAVYAQSIKPVRSDFSLLKTLKIFMSNIADQKNRVYRKY